MEENSDFGGIEITYRLSDLYAVTLRAWRYFLRVLLTLEALWIVTVFVIEILDGASLDDAVRWLPWRIFVWGGLAILAFWFAVCPIIRYIRTRRSGLLGPTRLSLSAPGIKIETSKIDSLVRWPAIKRITRSPNRVFLFVTSASAVILPRRAFDTDSRFDRWGEFAADKVRSKSVTVE